MLQDTNRALQLYMNKILMKIINNKQLEDVLSIDQPVKPKPVVMTPPILQPPTPTKTVSTVNPNTNTSNTANRQRRRTISYWGTKVPPPPPSKTNSEMDLDEENRRRHSSILSPPQPERSVSTSTTGTNGGWAKALRRMSVIGWSSVKEENPPISHTIQNDSAVGSLSEEEEISRKSSGSSTPSIRRSNELGTLAEEE